MKKIILLVTVLLFSWNSLSATEYKVDTKNSSVSFKIRHAVIATVKGTIDEFEGTYEYNDDSNYFIAFSGEAKTASVNTKDKYRDEHLRTKVFDVKKYPTMSLKLIKQDGSSFLTELTIKGITKEIEFNISLSAEKEKSFILKGEISRKDFNLKFSDTAEVGGIAVGDTIKIEVEFSGTAS